MLAPTMTWHINGEHDDDDVFCQGTNLALLIYVYLPQSRSTIQHKLGRVRLASVQIKADSSSKAVNSKPWVDKVSSCTLCQVASLKLTQLNSSHGEYSSTMACCTTTADNFFLITTAILESRLFFRRPQTGIH